jgi:hypothetical protein
MMVGLYFVIQEMGIFPMSVANNFCDMPLPKYLDLKTVLIYRPHPVQIQNTEYRIQNTEYRIQNTEYRIQNTEYKIQNTEYRTQNTE